MATSQTSRASSTGRSRTRRSTASPTSSCGQSAASCWAGGCRTRIERGFDPEAVRRMKASAARDLSIAGPELDAQAIEASLVDEVHLLLTPVIVGGGKRSLPAGARVKLELRTERRFGNEVVHVRYRIGN